MTNLDQITKVFPTLEPVHLGAIACYALETTLIAEDVGFFSVDISPDTPPEGIDWAVLEQVQNLPKRDRLVLVNRIINRLMGIPEIGMNADCEEVA